MRSARARGLVGVFVPWKRPLDALVDEPQPGLHAQDGLAHHPEAEVPGFDEAGVDRADRDLVDAGSLDRDEGERPPVGDHRRHRPASWRIGCQPSGQCWCRTRRRGWGWPTGTMPNRSGELALEPAGRKREPAKVGTSGRCPVERHVELDAAVRRPGGEEVDDAHRRAVVVTRDQGEAHPVGEQGLRRRRIRSPRLQRGGQSGDAHGHAIAGLGQRAREGHGATTRAAASSRPVQRPGEHADDAHRRQPPTSGAATEPGGGACVSAGRRGRAACGGRGRRRR